MEKKGYETILIGGGAAGLFTAATLLQRGARPQDILLIEGNDRVGKKLSATGNGQGNVSNLAVKKEGYFSSDFNDQARAQAMVAHCHDGDMQAFFHSLGVPLTPDERGRIYPASKQASALTDALRFLLAEIPTRLSERVVDIANGGDAFTVVTQTAEGEKRYRAKNVVLCTGGKAAKNFGTDGSAYALVTKFGHTVTPLYPSLVQVKTEVTHIKTLKGIRVNDGKVTAHGKWGSVTLRGDIIFTDYGVSGDAIFRISAYIADKIAEGVTLSIDFAPDFTQAELSDLLHQKRNAYPDLPTNECLFGIVNNQIGRAIFRRAEGELERVISLVKEFPLTVTGSLGFDYAQVTKGGIPLSETDKRLQSIFVQNLYFAGEILDVDGACGGFNLQWAFTSANLVAEGILAK